MPAQSVAAVEPFGVIKNDTYPAPAVALYDGDGAVIDPSGFNEVTLERFSATGEVTQMTGTLSSDRVTFPWATDETSAGAEWETNVVVNEDGTLKYTLSCQKLYVHDLSTMWCTVADVEALIGQGYSQYDILAAIETAQSVVAAWVTSPVGSPVPDRVRQATAILAARAVTADFSDGGYGSGGVIEERIQDYSVVYSEAQGFGTIWAIDGALAELLLPWKMKAYMTDVGEERGSSEEDWFDV